MCPPPTDSLDRSQSHEDDFDNIDFEQLSHMASQLLNSDDDKENGAFPVTQLAQTPRSKHPHPDGEELHAPRTPVNSEMPRTPRRSNQGDGADGASLAATSELLQQTGYQSPPPPPPPAFRPPNQSADSRPHFTGTLKRKYEDIQDKSYFPEEVSTSLTDEIDDFTEMTESFDPTEDVIPFEFINLPNDTWDRLQDEQKEQIRRFHDQILHASMTMSINVTHALFNSNEATRNKLVASINKIKTEEDKHRQNVMQFRRFAELLDSGMMALSGLGHEREGGPGSSTGGPQGGERAPRTMRGASRAPR